MMQIEAREVAAWIGGALALAGILVTLGRLVERIAHHRETLKAHGERLDSLEDGQAANVGAMESLRGEMKGLGNQMGLLVKSLERFTEKLERHLEGAGSK